MSLTISGILRTKFYAIILGTVGVGIASQLLSFSGLISSIGTAGIPLGLTKFVSEWEKDGKWSDIRDTVTKFIIILFSLGILFILFTILFSKQISKLLLDSDSYSTFLIMTAVAIPFLAVTAIFDAFLRGLKKFDKYVRLSVITSVISLAISVISVGVWGLSGLPLSIVIPSIFSLAVFLYFFKRNNFFSLRDLGSFNFGISESLKVILKIGAASLFDLVLYQITLLGIRSTIIKHLGISTNGIYQTVFAISNNYLSLFFMSLWVYVLPVLSEMKLIDEINNEINNALRFTLFVIFPVIALTYVLREYVIILFYTSKFLEASNFLIYNFIGDYVRALSWVLGAWLIPRAMIKLWLSMGIIFNVLYYSIFYILINFVFFDLRSIVISYAFANIVHLALSFYFSRKINMFRFRTDVKKLLIISSACLITIIIFSNMNIVWGYFTIIPVCAIWLKTCIKKEEAIKFLQLMKLGFLIRTK